VKKRGPALVLSFFFIGGLIFWGGAVWTYLDEHSGRATEATVTRCVETGSGKGSNLFCDGTWTLDGKRFSGSVYNGRKGDVGKTISVRIHGNHASKPMLWVSIALVLMGSFVLGVGVMVLMQVRKQRAQPT
jgi:hypothetical protein